MRKHDELIERLRKQSAELADTGITLDYSAGVAAADALEAQAREIEALKSELARARASAELIREALQTMREVE